MELLGWGGGLERREIEAIEKIKKTFSSNSSLNELNKKSGKTFGLAELKKSMPNNTMFPWKGYYGFRLID